MKTAKARRPMRKPTPAKRVNLKTPAKPNDVYNYPLCENGIIFGNPSKRTLFMRLYDDEHPKAVAMLEVPPRSYLAVPKAKDFLAGSPAMVSDTAADPPKISSTR